MKWLMMLLDPALSNIRYARTAHCEPQSPRLAPVWVMPMPGRRQE